MAVISHKRELAYNYFVHSSHRFSGTVTSEKLSNKLCVRRFIFNRLADLNVWANLLLAEITGLLTCLVTGSQVMSLNATLDWLSFGITHELVWKFSKNRKNKNLNVGYHSQ